VNFHSEGQTEFCLEFRRPSFFYLPLTIGFVVLMCVSPLMQFSWFVVNGRFDTYKGKLARYIQHYSTGRTINCTTDEGFSLAIYGSLNQWFCD